MLDVEADGPVPGLYSMIELGVVLCRDPKQTFYGRMRPITEGYITESLAVFGMTRNESLTLPDPGPVMADFMSWVKTNNELGTKPTIIADNNSFDYPYLNYYLWKFYGANPFGWSSRNLNDIYHGMMKNSRASFKHLRKTRHSHNPIDDSMGNVEALYAMIDMGYKVKL